jgi:tRNA (guanine37-N1)-methyltransferase
LLKSSLEIIGDIAVLKVPDVLVSKQAQIAEALMEWNRRIKVVMKQTSPVGEEFRIRGLSWVAGEKRTETLHCEHGCRFRVDVAKVYFSPRLQFERRRIAGLVKPGEVVLNMFAGVGCFSILIAKRASPAKVYSVDINPAAVDYLRENIRLNKVEGVVIPVLGDAREVVLQRLTGLADRVLLPLPEKAYDYLDVAVSALKGGGGFIHYYDFVKMDASSVYPQPLIERVSSRLRELGARPVLDGWRTVRSVGPGWHQVVLDMEYG